MVLSQISKEDFLGPSNHGKLHLLLVFVYLNIHLSNDLSFSSKQESHVCFAIVSVVDVTSNRANSLERSRLKLTSTADWKQITWKKTIESKKAINTRQQGQSQNRVTVCSTLFQLKSLSHQSYRSWIFCQLQVSPSTSFFS